MRGRPRLWPPLALLLAAFGLAIGAGFFAPCDPAEQDRDLPFAPPARLHFVDPEGAFHLRPFVYRRTLVPGTFDEYVEDRARAFPLRLLAADPAGAGGIRLLSVDRPARLHLLGTDGFGRDLFSRLLHGGRVSLFAGLLAGVLTSAIGLVLGALGGYFRGWVDELLMRLSELFLALPWLYLLLAARAFLPLSLTPAQAFLLLGRWEAIRFRYLAFGLSPSLAEDYVGVPQPLAPALAAVMRSKKWDRVEQRLECMRAISRQAKHLDLSHQYVLGRIVGKYLKLGREDEERYLAQLRLEQNKEVNEMVVTWEEALAAREDRGEARGKLEATRKAIVLLAKSCGCEVPADFEEKLAAINDLDKFYHILEQIPRIRSAEELDLG